MANNLIIAKETIYKIIRYENDQCISYRALFKDGYIIAALFLPSEVIICTKCKPTTSPIRGTGYMNRHDNPVKLDTDYFDIIDNHFNEIKKLED